MAPDFKTYLATEILSEQKTLSYRNISRNFKVHVNAAKCMLYEFYERENKKDAGSVYATYLIAGTKKISEISTTIDQDAPDTNGDVAMPSSPPPFPSSMADSSQKSEHAVGERLQVPVKTITLVREEDLYKVKEQYDKITSIHIYSLSPGKLQDLQVLTDVNRGLFADVFSKEDPLSHNKAYGVIQNSYVRRRKGKRPTNISAPQPKAAPAALSKPAGGIASKLAAQPTKKDEPSRPSSRDSTSTADSKTKPTLKKDTSSIFKAFAKQPPKPKLDRQNTDASGSGMDDTKMTDANDEGESEEEALFLDTNTRTGSKKRASDVQREKDERQAKLRKMMDSDDEAEAEVPTVTEATDINADPPAAKVGTDPDNAVDGDEEEVAWSESDSEKKQAKSTEPKRRRGKRKVMKKRTMKDEDGYLVTREEEAWESFSEDEPEPKGSSKPKAVPSTAKKQTSQKPSGTPAGGKKDITSFFGRK